MVSHPRFLIILNFHLTFYLCEGVRVGHGQVRAVGRWGVVIAVRHGVCINVLLIMDIGMWALFICRDALFT